MEREEVGTGVGGGANGAPGGSGLLQWSESTDKIERRIAVPFVRAKSSVRATPKMLATERDNCFVGLNCLLPRFTGFLLICYYILLD